MSDSEKVIKGLRQHCDGSMFDRCGECSYYEIDDKPFECRDALLKDAFALLRVQEPRVLTLDEVEKYVGYFDDIRPQAFEKLPLWTESKDGTNIFSGYRDVANIRELIQTSGLDRNYIAYKHWRCWSSYPTVEQRKEVPWDD